MLVFCSLHCVAAHSFVGYIPEYAPSALARAPCASSKILRIMLVFCSLHCVAAHSFVGYIPEYAPSALARAPCESSKILRIMLVFLRIYCVTARSLRYSHTPVCSVPRNSRALYIRKNPAHTSCAFFLKFIVQKLSSP